MYKFFFLLVVFTIQLGYTQKLSDKDFLIYQDLVRFHMSSNHDSAFVYVDKIKVSDNYSHLAFAYAAEAYLHQLKNADTLKSNASFNQAYFYFNNIKNKKGVKSLKIDILNYQGLTYSKQVKLNLAIEKYLEAKQIALDINDRVQFAKITGNIALIYGKVGNYVLAINSAKECENFINSNENLFTNDKLILKKANTYINLGYFYESFFYQNKSRLNLLDSSEYYYKKALIYSKDLVNIKIKCQINLSNIYILKRKPKKAEKLYLSTLILAKENNLESYISVNYNLGDLYYNQSNYHKALIHFKKVDSLCQLYDLNRMDHVDCMFSMAKIYNFYNDINNSEKYLSLYNSELKKNSNTLLKQQTDINSKLASEIVKKEVLELQEEINFKRNVKYLYVFIVIIIVLILLFFLYKIRKEKKLANDKIIKLIEEFKNKLEIKELSIDDNEEVILNNSLSIDEEKENEIIDKLRKLEDSKYFLNADFNLQKVAKKIKTNTTYLSYVVNKRIGKSFSEYSNELKINYVIDELIHNVTYRKYSTQAIAESVGFKNAVSFSKSFNKRTGVTPAQFIKKISEID